MKRIIKVALILSLVILIPPIAVYAVSVLTVTVPGSVTVVSSSPGLEVLGYSGTFPSGSCNSTQITSLPFSNVLQGQSQTVYVCLEDTGGATYFFTGSSLNTNLASAIGTLSPSYYIGASSSSTSPPIQMVYGNEIVAGLLLTIQGTATTGTASFSVNFQVFSTSTG
ncbi:MAG: hypothetical protein JRN20_19585 [Nitrososphaerota archaeon]|jgi:hypothetical protein|nr:hypothetical protein [Nitrososphaerota archaeon]MDG6924208.1 hypothetical protein [Nitrososphaerota archaeon]